MTLWGEDLDFVNNQEVNEMAEQRNEGFNESLEFSLERQWNEEKHFVDKQVFGESSLFRKHLKAAKTKIKCNVMNQQKVEHIEQVFTEQDQQEIKDHLNKVAKKDQPNKSLEDFTMVDRLKAAANLIISGLAKPELNLLKKYNKDKESVTDTQRGKIAKIFNQSDIWGVEDLIQKGIIKLP